MNVCIKCNPVSVLIEDDDGMHCPIHGKDYLLEVQPARIFHDGPQPNELAARFQKAMPDVPRETDQDGDQASEQETE